MNFGIIHLVSVQNFPNTQSSPHDTRKYVYVSGCTEYYFFGNFAYILNKLSFLKVLNILIIMQNPVLRPFMFGSHRNDDIHRLVRRNLVASDSSHKVRRQSIPPLARIQF